MTMEQTSNDDQSHESLLAGLISHFSAGDDFEHGGESYIVEEDAEGGKRLRNLISGKRSSFEELFPNISQGIEEDKEAARAAAAESLGSEEEATQQDTGEAIAALAVKEGETKGLSHAEAVHDVAAHAVAEAQKIHEELAGIPKPPKELPPQAAEGAKIVKTETFGEISIAERKKVIEKIFSVNRELYMIDGEIRSLKNDKDAKDEDLKRLKQSAGAIRRDIHKLIRAAAPEMYTRFAEKNPEIVGTPKERAVFLSEFKAHFRDVTESQKKADAIFEAEVFKASQNLSGVESPEMQHAEEKIDSAVEAQVGATDVSDIELTLETAKAVADLPAGAEVISAEAGPMSVDEHLVQDIKEGLEENGRTMQEEMDALSIGQGAHHEDWEVAGSEPRESEDTNMMAAHPYTTHGTTHTPSEGAYAAPNNVTSFKYKDANVAAGTVNDWSSFASRGSQYRATRTHIPSVALRVAPVNIEATPSAAPVSEEAKSPEAIPESSVEAKKPQTLDEKFAAAAALAHARSLEAKAAPRETISSDVFESFEFDLGISREALEKDPSFGKLTHEQQRLVLRDVATFAVGNIKESTRLSLEREWEGQGKIGHISETAKKFISFGLLGNKGVLTARKTQEEIARMASVGEGKSGQDRVDFLRDIARKRLEQNPSVSIETDGTLRVNAVSLESVKTPEGREAVERYNSAAASWARIPEYVRQIGASDMNAPAPSGIAARFFSRRVAGLTPAEQVQYESARNEYEEAEGLLSSAFMRERSDITDPKTRENVIAQDLLAYRDRIAMEQFFGSNPNAEAELLSMENPATWSQALSGMLRAAPAHMAYGALARAGAVAALGALGVPAAAAVAPLMVAAGVSGYMGRKQELAKARAMLKERRASGAISEADMHEKDIIIINYERALRSKEEELRLVAHGPDKAAEERLQREVAEAQTRLNENGKTVRIERELSEFRDAKHFVARMERLLASRETANSLAVTGDVDAAERMQLLESKIAKTASIMRSFKSQGMINYKRGYLDSSHAQGYADFAEALSKAEIAVSVDELSVHRDVYENLVGSRRTRLDEAAQKRISREVTKGVLTRMGYALAGSLISMEFFRGGVAHVAEGAHAGVAHMPKGDVEKLGSQMGREVADEILKEEAAKKAAGHGIASVNVDTKTEATTLPDEIRKAQWEADKKAAWEWQHSDVAERTTIEKVTGLNRGHLAGVYAAANSVGEYKNIPEGASSYEATVARPSAPHAEAHLERAPVEAPTHLSHRIESSHGVHIVARGETFAAIMRNMNELKGLSLDAREIAVADFVKHANPEQLRAVGITSGNVDTLAGGQHVDMEKLGEMIRHSTYRGTPLLEHARMLAAGEAQAGVARAAVPYDENALNRLVKTVSGAPSEVAKDDAGFEKLITKVQSGAGSAVETMKASPEVSAKVHASIENVFAVFPDKGEHLRSMRADDVINKPSPYRWTSVPMNSEFNALKVWMKDVQLKTHIEPMRGETVEQYLADVYTKLQTPAAAPAEVAAASKQALAVEFSVENAAAKATEEVASRAGVPAWAVTENLGFEKSYVDQNHMVFQAKSVDAFMKEEPGHIRAIGVEPKDYFMLQSRLITFTARTPAMPGESVFHYMHRIAGK